MRSIVVNLGSEPVVSVIVFATVDLSFPTTGVWTRSIATMENMAGRECYHCKQWVEEGEEHDCWTTTETALMQDLSGNLQDA